MTASERQAEPGTAPVSSRHAGTSLVVGAMLNWLSLGLHVVVSFVITPIIIHKLGAEDFGMWALIQSFSGYYGLVNLGFGSALLKAISHDMSIKNWDSLQETVSTATAFFAATGGTILLVIAIIGMPLAKLFNVADADAPAFALTTFIAAGAVITEFSGALRTTIINACERFDLMNSLSIGRQLVSTTAILVMLWLRPSILGIAIILLVTSLGALFFSTRICRRLLPEARFTTKGFRFARLKELMSYGGSTVLLSISNLVRLRIGNMIVAMTSGLAAVASYSIAASLVTNLTQVVSVSMNVLGPRFTKFHARNEMTELTKLYRSSLFVSAMLSFGLGSMLVLFGETFINLWVGKSVADSVPILNILVIGYVAALAQAPGWNMMFALAKHHFMAMVALGEAAVIIGLGFWLGHLYGVTGFAWATLLAMLAVKIFIQPYYSAKIVGMNLRDYLIPMVIPAFCAALFFGTARALDFQATLRSHGVIYFTSSAVLYATGYAALTCFMAKKKDYAPPMVGKVLHYI